MNKAGTPDTVLPLLRLVGIHKSYAMGSTIVPVLRGVDLHVNPGEFVAIMGASGSGKSTLLHIAGILDRPDFDALPENTRDVGAIPYAGKRPQNATLPYRQPGTPAGVVDGETGRTGGEVFYRVNLEEDAAGIVPELAVSRLSIFRRHWLRNQKIGFVFQFYHLLPELNVVENVLLPAMVEAPLLMGLFGARPRRERALQLIESFGLSHRLKHRPGQLSGGERQRVAIARALINQPAILLADEPTGNLDSKTGRSILDVLIQLHQEQHQTMLLVTHDPNVAALADRTVHLVEGRIKT